MLAVWQGTGEASEDTAAHLRESRACQGQLRACSQDMCGECETSALNMSEYRELLMLVAMEYQEKLHFLYAKYAAAKLARRVLTEYFSELKERK